MKFYKYQCCGNDFIITDKHVHRVDEIQRLCERRFGIGADGLIFVDKNNEGGFNINFYNRDGSTDTFCGNGSICAVDYAVKHLEIENNSFIASNGKHLFEKKDKGNYEITLNDTDKPCGVFFNHTDKKMLVDINVNEGFFCNTGSPHFVLFVDDVEKIDINTLGKYFRENINKLDGGANVDFVQILKRNVLKIRTFERGVEEETMACGTGSVAAAVTYAEKMNDETLNKITLHNKGGQHFVSFSINNDIYSKIKLMAKPMPVFCGEIEL